MHHPVKTFIHKKNIIYIGFTASDCTISVRVFPLLYELSFRKVMNHLDIGLRIQEFINIKVALWICVDHNILNTPFETFCMQIM